MGGRVTEVPLTAAEPRSVLEAGSADAPRRIGVLGGTFDPPHVGHLWLASLAADEMSLGRVLFMPAGQPPHKRQQPVTRATDRLLMTRLAIAGEDGFEICPIEIERPGPSFTIDSIVELRRAYPDANLFLVMASDSLAQIDTWREPERLLAEVEWIVGPRLGGAAPDAASLGERFGPNAERIHLLAGPMLDISSSAIRRRVAAGRTIRYLVPREVEELISHHRLYRRG